jgi:hypothetical protein
MYEKITDLFWQLSVEPAVARLLVSIKALLESLTNWSQLRVDENEVSNMYVQFGNDFNTTIAAFGLFNIDMSCVVNSLLCLISLSHWYRIAQGAPVSAG